MSITLDESGGGLAGLVRYSTVLFEAATILRLTGHMTALLGAVTADPRARVRDLLSAGERDQLLVIWDDTAVPVPAVGGVHELITARAAECPDAVAVVSGEERLTYSWLAQRAGRLAAVLREAGVGRRRWSGCACRAASPW